MRPTVHCLLCLKDLYKAPSDIKRNKTGKFFCGQKHRAAYALRELDKKKRLEELKYERILYTCPKCFTDLAHEEDRYGKIFRCIKCGFLQYGKYVDKWLDDVSRA